MPEAACSWPFSGSQVEQVCLALSEDGVDTVLIVKGQPRPCVDNWDQKVDLISGYQRPDA